ncbi:carboxymuconolactone decarboxylase family protein [Arthrobacter castelli]|uniref:carboxymuconolactone decarboxylase family protein n=1 Tax=Arthrobacter castelli TaxID=271431 RepID=UPI00040D06C1|nr:carboxymuconolactone decarboxylase family protein [Arthrobacter castelli]
MNTTHSGDQPDLDTEVEQARYDRGAEVLATVDGTAGQHVVDALADVAPALAHHVVAYGFGDVYARPGLTAPQRQLVTLGILTALDGCESQLEVHINASLNVGLSAAEIVEAITHAAVYCGFPKALNATFTAKRVFADHELLPVTAPPATGNPETADSTGRTVQGFFDSLANGEPVSAMFAESVDHYVPGAQTVPWTGRRSTRAEVSEFFDLLGEHLQPRSFEVSQLFVHGSDAVALGRFAYTVRSNGRPFEGQFALHLTIENGLITRYHMYEDSYALEQAVTGH